MRSVSVFTPGFRPETGLQALCEGSFWLAEQFGELSLRFLRELGVAPSEVDHRQPWPDGVASAPSACRQDPAEPLPHRRCRLASRRCWRRGPESSPWVTFA